jgi:hypothetical protein
LINFFNDKQTQEGLENGFPKTTFQKTNAALDDSLALKKKQTTNQIRLGKRTEIVRIVKSCVKNS